MNPLLDDPSPGPLDWTRTLLDATGAAARCKTPGALAEIVEELLVGGVGDRASCLFHDPSDGTLWSATEVERAGSVEAGIAGASVRDQRPLLVLRADRDPRFVAAVDDPRGDGRAKLYVHPVGRESAVHAVLVVARPAELPPFSAACLERVGTIAYHLGPVIEAFALREELESAAETCGPYRKEAVDARREAMEPGGLLHTVSPWVRRTYALLAAICVVGAAASAVVRIGEHVSGPCVVYVGPTTEVRAPVSGLVATIHVAPGQPVVAGQPLIELADAEGDAALERLALGQQLQLRNLLRDPSDRAAQQAVVAGRTERTYLEARRAERTLRAPFDGRVQQLWIGPGQQVEVGQTLAGLAEASRASVARVVALLPGEALPHVRADGPIAFRVDGSTTPYVARIVPPLPEAVLPADAARRLLGERVGDLPAERGVVVVHAALTGPASALGDGMRGAAEIELRSVPLWVALIPGMETMW